MIIFGVAKGQKGCDTIYWSSSKKLQVGDFKDAADTAKTMVAFTLAKFGYKAIPQSDEVIIITSNYFLPCRSWLNPVNISNNLLHEQLHFDISEYYRRLFLQRLSETAFASDAFPSAVKAIFRDIAAQRKTMDMEYDKETNTGTNLQQQKKWINKIHDLLKNLEKFSPSEVVIKLK